MESSPHFIAEGFEGQQLYRVPVQALQRIRSRSFTKDFVVTDLGYFPPSLGHGISRRNGVKQWILIFVNSGNGWVETTGKRRPVSENQIILIPPKHAHAYGASESNPWSVYWFHFEGQGATDLLKWIGGANQGDLLHATSPESLRRQFASILSAVGRGYHDHTLLELSRVLINVLTLLHRNPLRQHRNEAFERIESIMNTMRTELSRPKSLQDYAKLSRLSVPQFCHLFKRHTGVSPMVYLTELRMQRACEYLDTSDLNVKAIALELGFEDPLYFSRAFKRCVGKSPRQYREA